MSLNAALSNALSGLFSSSKAVELISSNVANAKTPSYVKRTLALSTRQVSHGGVTIDAVIRNNDNYTLTQYQRSEGDYLNAQTLSSYFKSVELASKSFGDRTSDTVILISIVFTNSLFHSRADFSGANSTII